MGSSIFNVRGILCEKATILTRPGDPGKGTLDSGRNSKMQNQNLKEESIDIYFKYINVDRLDSTTMGLLVNLAPSDFSTCGLVTSVVSFLL